MSEVFTRDSIAGGSAVIFFFNFSHLRVQTSAGTALAPLACPIALAPELLDEDQELSRRRCPRLHHPFVSGARFGGRH
jgi:hypothetical protein